MNFKAWFWGLNCDNHAQLVRKIVPVMPIIEDSFDALERRTDAVADEEKFEECIEIDISSNDQFNQQIMVENEGTTTFDRKAARKQRHKIKEFFLEKACRAVEIQLRTKHGLVPSNELNEQALRMSAVEICRFYNMNDMDTMLLSMKPVYKAMIPDQQQMDALRIIYNSETSGRVATVEALRNSASYAHFTSGHYA